MGPLRAPAALSLEGESDQVKKRALCRTARRKARSPKNLLQPLVHPGGSLSTTSQIS